MHMNNRRIYRSLCAASVLIAQNTMAQTVPIYALASAPTVDGDAGDWAQIPATTVSLHKTRPDSVVAAESVSIRGGTRGGRVYLLVEWRDQSADTIHKPWVWDADQGKYLAGPQREDRLAIHWSTDSSYTTDWRSGNEFSADTWHWKASRSNPLGLAHDKSLTISHSKLVRAAKVQTASGGHVYVARPSDSGDKLYTTTRYRRFAEPLMPKYLLTGNPTGSVADVTARGVWADGLWRLEFSRKLSTGNEDDVALPSRPGKVMGGIAVFDRSENEDHAISETLSFDFLHQPPPPY